MKEYKLNDLSLNKIFKKFILTTIAACVLTFSYSQATISKEFYLILEKSYPIYHQASEKADTISQTKKTDTIRILKAIDNKYIKIGEKNYLIYDSLNMTIERKTTTTFIPQSPNETYEFSEDYRSTLGKKGVVHDWKAKIENENIDIIDIDQVDN